MQRVRETGGGLSWLLPGVPEVPQGKQRRKRKTAEADRHTNELRGRKTVGLQVRSTKRQEETEMKKRNILASIVVWLIIAAVYAGIFALYVGIIGLFIFVLSRCFGFIFTWGLALGAALILAAAAVFVWLVK